MLLETTVSGPVAAGQEVRAFLLVEIRPYLVAENYCLAVYMCVCVCV